MIYEIIQRVDLVLDLRWEWKVIDAIGDQVPNDEREQIIQSLIPDCSMRNSLEKAKAH